MWFTGCGSYVLEEHQEEVMGVAFWWKRNFFESVLPNLHLSRIEGWVRCEFEALVGGDRGAF